MKGKCYDTKTKIDVHVLEASYYTVDAVRVFCVDVYSVPFVSFDALAVAKTKVALLSSPDSAF